MTLSQDHFSVDISEARPRPSLSPEVLKRCAHHPPGMLTVSTREVGTYRDFLVAYRALVLPNGSGETLVSGGEMADSRNVGFAQALANPTFQWLMLLDDDHSFPPDLVLNMLDVMEREGLDMMGPIYLARLSPPTTLPIGNLYKRDDDGKLQFRKLEWSDLPQFSPVLERKDLCLGTSGLIIKRRVIEGLQPPYFQLGQVVPDKESEDIFFSVRVQEAGFRVGLWLGDYRAGGPVGIGHVCRATLWATRDGKGNYGVGMHMDQAYRNQETPPLSQNGGRLIVER